MRRDLLSRRRWLWPILAVALLAGTLSPSYWPVAHVGAISNGLLMPVPVQQFFSDSGVPLAGAKLYTYLAGTTWPAATYSDVGLTTPNTNPVVADAGGRMRVYLPRGIGYKLTLKTSADVTVWDQDDVSVPSEIVPPSPAAVPTGAVLPYAGTSAPTGYLLCQGQAVDRVVYAALFSVLGTTYGAGDGSTTFNVPDLQQRFPLGKAAAGTGSTLGGTGGTIDHVHTGPSHTHTTAAHTHTVPDTGYGGAGGEAGRMTTGTVSGATTTPATSGTALTSDAGGTANTGTGNPPFLSVNFIVKI
jgi:microcystin-dependent protein